VNNNNAYNDKSSALLNANLGMSFAKMKQVICLELGWNYNDIKVDITWKFQVKEY